MSIVKPIGYSWTFDLNDAEQLAVDSYPTNAQTLIFNHDTERGGVKWAYGYLDVSALRSSTNYRCVTPYKVDPNSTYEMTNSSGTSIAIRFLCTLGASRTIVRQSSVLAYLKSITTASNEQYLILNGAQSLINVTKTATTDIIYSVKFTTNTTTTLDDIWVTEGSTLGEDLPTDLVRTGYTFTGWLDTDGNKFTKSSTIKDDITLIAQWKSNISSSYKKTTWVNDSTIVKASSMNNIEDGIEQCLSESTTLGINLNSLTTKVDSLSTTISNLQEEIINSDEFESRVNEIIESMDLDYDAIAKSGWQGKKVGWMGDSLTQGNAWCTIVNKLFNFNATNLGVGGTTVSYEGVSSMCMKERLTGDYSNVTDENTGEVTVNGKVTPTDLDVMFFQGGTNDWARNHPIGTKTQKFGNVTTNLLSASTDGVIGEFSSLDDDLNITVTESSDYKCYKIEVDDSHTYSLSDGNSFTYWSFTEDGTQLTTGDTTSYGYEDTASFIIIQAAFEQSDTYVEDTWESGYLNSGKITSNTSYRTSQYFPVTGGITFTSSTSLRFINYFKDTTFLSAINTTTAADTEVTVPTNATQMRFSCSTTQSPTITFSESIAKSNYYIISTTTEQEYSGDKAYVYDSCYWLFENLKNYETNLDFEVIALGTGFGQMKNRASFGGYTYGVLNKLELTTIDYGDVLVDAAGEWGYKGINIGREMGINTMNNSTYIPDGLHFTTTYAQKRAAEVIINFLLSHEPRKSNL